MRTASVFDTVSRVVLLVGAVVVATPQALAEVGAAPTGAPRLRIYQLGVISEDPTPFNGIWADFGGSASGRSVLNAEGAANGDGPPSIAISPTHTTALVAWARNSAAGFDVVVSRYDGAAWTAEQVVVGELGVNELDPQIVIAADGSVHLFYWVDGPTPRVFYTSAPADFSVWSTPIPVSPSGQVTCRPAGAFYDGVLRVVYEVHTFGYGSTPREVVIARYENGEFVTEVVATTGHGGDVRPQVHSHGGKLWVDWIDTETTGHAGELAWTRLNAQGQWEPVSYQTFDNVEQREYLVRGGARMLAIQP